MSLTRLTYHVMVSLGAIVFLTHSSSARADGFGPHAAVPTSGFGHLDRSGMNEHVIRGAYEGLITGLSIGYALSSDSDERTATRVGTGAVLGGAAGVVLPLVLNRGDKEVRTGDVIFLNVAQNWGFAHGFLVPYLFQLSRFGSGESVDLNRGERRLDLGLAAGLSLAAGGLAAYASSDLSFTPGQAGSLGAAGLWGGLGGLLIVEIMGPENPGARWEQASIAAALTFANASMLTTWANRDRFDVDRSRVLMIHIGGIAGVLVGIAAAYFIDPGLNNHRVIAGSMLVGAGVGVGTGYYLSDGWDEFKNGVPPSNASGLSLFQLRNGRWTGGLPAPLPMALPDSGGQARIRTTFSLADGRF